MLFLVCLCGGIVAQDMPYVPKEGGAERKAIMDALRKPVEAKLKQKVIFVISNLKAQNGWAFLVGTPQQPDGKPIDYKITPYREAYEDGAFDNSLSALLRKQGDLWRVVALDIGSTDVVWEDWDKRYKALSAIFK